jgi:hypothetical protein
MNPGGLYDVDLATRCFHPVFGDGVRLSPLGKTARTVFTADDSCGTIVTQSSCLIRSKDGALATGISSGSGAFPGSILPSARDCSKRGSAGSAGKQQDE